MLYYIAGYDHLRNLSSRVYWYGIYLNSEDAQKKLLEYIQEYNMLPTGLNNNCAAFETVI